MKRLVSWLMSGVLLASLLFGLVMAPTAQAADLSNVADEKIAERGDKVDLNNCSVRRFQAFPGMYPTLAGKIVLAVLTTPLTTCSTSISPIARKSW